MTLDSVPLWYMRQAHADKERVRPPFSYAEVNLSVSHALVNNCVTTLFSRLDSLPTSLRHMHCLSDFFSFGHCIDSLDHWASKCAPNKAHYSSSALPIELLLTLATAAKYGGLAESSHERSMEMSAACFESALSHLWTLSSQQSTFSVHVRLYIATFFAAVSGDPYHSLGFLWESGPLIARLFELQLSETGPSTELRTLLALHTILERHGRQYLLPFGERLTMA